VPKASFLEGATTMSTEKEKPAKDQDKGTDKGGCGNHGCGCH